MSLRGLSSELRELWESECESPSAGAPVVHWVCSSKSSRKNIHLIAGAAGFCVAWRHAGGDVVAIYILGRSQCEN